MTWWAVGAMAVSTVVSMASANEQAQQSSARNKAAAKAEEYNAAVARNKADNTRAVYDQKSEKSNREARYKIGQMRAAGAQAGVGMGGSVADTEHQSAVNAELDSMNIQYQGSLEAQGLDSQANMDDYSAAGYKISADNAINSGNLAMGAAMASGVAKYYSITKTPAAATAPTVD